jgi:hypothetical protein
MNADRSLRPIRNRLAGLTAFALAGILLSNAMGSTSVEGSAGQAKSGTNRYIGAEKCKNCHMSDASGNNFAAWQKMDHAKAFATLASDKAKEIAKAKGIEDPQKSDACLKCHVTAFGLPADQIQKSMDAKLGVQCESCHGPGEQHFKARMAAAAKAGDDDKAASTPQAVPAGEIVSLPDQKTCLVCHNDQSPTFKPFCFQERVDKVRHDDPRKPHADRTKCGCDKCACVHGCDEKCAVPAKK